MRQLTVILLFISINAFPQTKIGIINDPDGYTNVRSDKSVESAIIAKLFDYQPFEFVGGNSNWVSVKLVDGGTGFIHKSRVREIGCSCENWGGLKLPLLVIPINNQIIEVCTSTAKKVINGKIEISESRISNCLTNEILLEIGAIDNAFLEIQKDSLIISNFMKLPIGQNWTIVKTPIKFWTLDLKSESVTFKETNGLKPPYASSTLSDNLVKSLREQPPKDMEVFAGVMYKLFVAAISGNKEAEEMFRDYKNKFGIALDGYVAEDFGTLRWMLDDYQRGN